MSPASFHTAAWKDIELFIGKFRVQRFVFSAASIDFDVSSFTWQLLIKKNPGARTNIISLTLNNGLSFPIYETNVIEARFQSATTRIEEGQYYWQLVKTDTDEPWVNGWAKFSFGPLGSQGSEQELTINRVDQEISVELSSIIQTAGAIDDSITNGVTDRAPSQNAVFDALALKLDKLVTANRQTDSYTLVLGDATKLVEMNKATANNLTVPLNSSVAFDTGTIIYVTQYGAGQTTIVATGGVTINSSSGSLLIPSRYSVVSLVKIGTNEWYLFNGSDSDDAWVDWSASVAPTGFSSLTTQIAYYKVRGDEVQFWCFISGTSNATTFTIQIPFALDAIYGAGGVVYPCLPTNAGTVVSGRLVGSGSSTTITIDATVVGGAFTASGVKALRAQLTYMK